MRPEAVYDGDICVVGVGSGGMGAALAAARRGARVIALERNQVLGGTTTMDADLQFLVHFFNEHEYLFKTITMAGASQADEICHRISSQKGWFWPRFAPSERESYLARRLFVEKEMYEGYTLRYGRLKERIPVYFYLYPNMDRQQALERGQQRTKHGETEPQVLLMEIKDIADTTNMTFTLNDSFRAYWKKALDSGITCRGDGTGYILLPDHNQVFPFSMIDQIHAKYKALAMPYEIQIWDYELLERTRYTILGKEET